MLAIAVPAASAKPDGFALGSPDCPLIEVPFAAPFGAGSCPGVRPGALLEVPEGFCTMNFLFQGRKKARYIATAGHCVINEQTGGERVFAKGKGPIAKDGEGKPIGRFAYGNLELDGDGDFALVKLFKSVKANPQMCHFGGPVSINRSTSPNSTQLSLYGNGTVIGEVLPARTLIGSGFRNPGHLNAVGAALPGDSGGPVTDGTGRAVGVLVVGGVLLDSVGTDGLDGGNIGISRLGPQLERARQKLGGGRLQLKTAPLR